MKSDDIPQVKRDKIALLSGVANLENWPTILREFVVRRILSAQAANPWLRKLKDYANDINDEVVSDAIMALGHCGTRIPEALSQSLVSLIQMIKSPYSERAFQQT